MQSPEQPGLSEEEKQQVLHAARSGIIELVVEHPEVRLLGADDLTTVFMAGVLAGVDATVRVFQVVGRKLGEES